MKADRIEINFIKNNHAINTIELEQGDIDVINESLKITYNTLSKKYIECITGGLKSISDSILKYEDRVKDLIGRLHE